MALGLNIRQPPAGFSPIPTYHAFHNFDHENFFSFFVDTCSILASIILWHFDFSYLEKNVETYLRGLDQDDHVKRCGASVTTCQEAVVSCQ